MSNAENLATAEESSIAQSATPAYDLSSSEAEFAAKLGIAVAAVAEPTAPAQRVVANPTGHLMVLGETGHDELAWDTRDPESVKAAQEKFDDLVGRRRYLAFKVNDDGTKGEQIKAFDPEIEDMILVPPMTGG